MQFEIKIKKPFSFVATMKTHGWFQLPPFYWDEDARVLNWATCIQNSKHLVRLQDSRETPSFSYVLCDVDDAALQPTVEQKFRYIMNLNLDLSGYYRLCEQDPLMAQVPKRGIGRLMRAESLFEDVFKSICATNVQWTQAVKMVHNIAALGDNLAGTEFFVFPSPHQIVKVGEDFLKERGRVGYRSSYLIELAKRFTDGEPDAARVESGDMLPNEMKKYFLSFKGVGKTTAHYLMALHGHYEEMAVDSLVIKYMKAMHFNGETPTEKQVVQFYERFGRWRYLIYWMEFIVNEGWNPDA